MSEHPNVTLIRDLFSAFQSGDIAAILEVVPKDAVWHFPGRAGQLAGDHVGREAILGFLAKVPGLTQGSFHLELVDILANDRNAVALFRGRGRRADRELDNPTCLRMRIENGRVRELWEFVWDLYAVDAFWT